MSAEPRAVAALPLYDWPGLHDAHDALWTAIAAAARARGLSVPERLSRDLTPMEGWCAPGLVLGQICSLPWRSRLRGRVFYVATLDYALPGLPAGYYESLVVRRRGERGPTPTLAINEALSHSGWAAAQGLAFERVILTGAHLASARAVAEGRADVAAIDAVSWRALARFAPEVARALDIAGHTPASPAPALVTASPHADILRAAVIEGVERAAPRAREALGIAGVTLVPEAAILDQPIPPAPPVARASA